MKLLSNMHPVSVLVILMILALFTVAVVMLFAVCKTYRRQAKLALTGEEHHNGNGEQRQNHQDHQHADGMHIGE